jgi:phospholipase/lecithinase/hemolysin
MKIKLFFWVIISSLCFINVHAHTKIDYDKIVFFGDSLTDNGNLYKTFLSVMPKSPPYFEGQFSNGPVWSEKVAAYFQQQKNDLIYENEAVGGETVVWHNPFDGYLPYMLSQSIDDYYLKSGSEDRSHTLFIFWLGANDYLSGAENVDEITTNVSQKIQEVIENLIDNGGKNFLILNLPDMSKTPFGKSSPLAANLFALVTMHNEKLAQTITQLQRDHADVNIRSFDIFAFFNKLMNDVDSINQQYHTHITNTQNACWSGSYVPNEKLSHSVAHVPDLAIAYQVGESFRHDETACNNPDDYLFWDQVHPTTVVHEILAQAIVLHLSSLS